ncbi:MAG: hypothetical protein QM820_45650 [Minicystis sp.]
MSLGAALSLAGALAAGCGSSGGGTGGSGGGAGAGCSGDLASIEQTIFKPTCATLGCHVGENAAGSLDLSGDTAGLLVNVPSATCPQQNPRRPRLAVGVLPPREDRRPACVR